MAKLCASILLTCFLLLGLLHQHLKQVQANIGPKSTHSAQVKMFHRVPEAIAQLLQFVPSDQGKVDRCRRASILLVALNRVGFLNRYEIIEFAITKSDKIISWHGQITIDRLRQLYKESIGEYMKERVDGGFLELVACMGSIFSDNQAREFLGDSTLKALVEQYKEVVSAPLEALLEPEKNDQLKKMLANHDELQSAIKQRLQQLLVGDTHKLNALLGNQDAGMQVETKAPTGQVAVAQAYAVASGPSVGAELANGAVPESAYQQQQREHDPTSDELLDVADEKAHEESLKLFDAILMVRNKMPEKIEFVNRCHSYSYVLGSDDPNMESDQFINAAIGQANQEKDFGVEDLENFRAAISFRDLIEIDASVLNELSRCEKEVEQHCKKTTTMMKPDE